MASPHHPGVAWEDFVAAYPRSAWAVLARTAGRYPEGRFFDDLAGLASDGTMDAADLITHARAGTSPIGIRFDPRGLAWFAHVVASRAETGTAAQDASALFALAYRVGGRRVLARQLDAVWIEALHLAGRLEEFRSALKRAQAPEGVWWAAEADDAHPGQFGHDGLGADPIATDGRSDGDAAADRVAGGTRSAGPAGPAQEWLQVLNRPFHQAGLEPVFLRPGTEDPFDRLAARAQPLTAGPVEGEPLVSVVVPVYNPGDSLRTAVGSLLAQTWSNLEIVLCDDASTRGTELFDALTAADPRVRVVHAPRNAGAYAARNLGIGHARGDFVTFNDADDWSHPRRIERQLNVLLEDPRAKASLSWSVRLTGDLRLTVMGRPPRRINLSSVMMRRSDILTHLGGFDAVRKGADSEFVGRVAAVFGADSLRELEEPLALVQLTAGSLSRDDYRFLRTHPARLQYMATFRHWHSTLSANPDAAYLPPGVRAPFPAPAYLTGRAALRHNVDVLVLANLSVEAPTVIDLAAEVRALTRMGLRVGLLEYLGPFDLTASVHRPTGDIAQLIHDGDVVRVLAGEQVHTRLALVRDPAAVQAMPADVLDAVHAERVALVADYSPAGGTRYQPALIATMLRERSNGDPLWLPATDKIARKIARTVDAATVVKPAPLGCVRAVRIGPVPALVRTDRSAVRGAEERGASDEGPLGLRTGVSLGSIQRMRPKDLAELMAGLVPAEPFEVLTWGPTRQILTSAPRSVTHLDPGETSVADFAAQVDVMIVARAAGRGAHLNPVAVTAMARGCVVLLEPAYRRHFGGAALYLDGKSATDWLQELASSPDLIDRQAARGAAFVREKLSATAVEAHVTRLLRHNEEAV